MSNTFAVTTSVALYLFQRMSIAIVAISALALTGYTVACLFGQAPWLSLNLQFGTSTIAQAGVFVQTGLTILVLTLLFYMPSHARMMALENSHRSFHMNMRDVARAYAASHQADRDGVFTLSSEFDSIRDRIAFLRAHPDLDAMEPDVMELAAQMSHVSRELAQVYSDRNVARARDFLIQRQEDIAEFEDRVRLAKTITEELTRWARRVDLEESVARSQLDQLRAELAEVLPELAHPPSDEGGTETHKGDPQPVPVSDSKHGPDINDEPDLYAEDDRIVALLARRADG